MRIARLACLGVVAIVTASCGSSTKEVATRPSDATASTTVAVAGSLHCWISGQVLTRDGVSIREYEDAELELDAIVESMDEATRRAIDAREPVRAMRVTSVEIVSNPTLGESVIASWEIRPTGDPAPSSVTSALPGPSSFEVVVGVYDVETEGAWWIMGEDGSSRSTYDECVAAPRAAR